MDSQQVVHSPVKIMLHPDRVKQEAQVGQPKLFLLRNVDSIRR
jgi:hypothetical protein